MVERKVRKRGGDRIGKIGWKSKDDGLSDGEEEESTHGMEMRERRGGRSETRMKTRERVKEKMEGEEERLLIERELEVEKKKCVCE